MSARSTDVTSQQTSDLHYALFFMTCFPLSNANSTNSFSKDHTRPRNSNHNYCSQEIILVTKPAMSSPSENPQNPQNRRDQPGLWAAHAEYMKGAAEVRSSVARLFLLPNPPYLVPFQPCPYQIISTAINTLQSTPH